MSDQTLKDTIRALALEQDAIILAHNYMRDEIQDVADITGDSLQLSQEAAKTAARTIVFCGVHFMAESAAILSPDKRVLIPRADAGCPMADMVDASCLIQLKQRNPGVPVVTYVNSTAAVKAESDICCTSANALSVVRSLPQDRLIFAPDRNLGRWVASQIPEKEFIFWDGYCPTHERLTAERVLQMKSEHPGACFVCHPECAPEVSALADHVCSTSGMYQYCATAPYQTFIIGTEAGVLWKLRNDNPEKTFVVASPALICPNMKLSSLEDVARCLETGRTVVRIPDDMRQKAKAALDRMLAVPRD